MKPASVCGWFFVALLPFVTGCPYHEYIVEMRPAPSGVERSLTCSRQEPATNQPVAHQEFPAPELNAIAACYSRGNHLITSNVHTFKAVFSGALPPDLDGWGRYTAITSRLGTAYSYVERFRGSTNLAAQVKDRLAAVDELTNILIGWLRRELGKRHGFTRLHHTLDTAVRHDLKELSLAWLLKGEQDDSDIRVMLVQRGYLPDIGSGDNTPLVLAGFDVFLRRQLGDARGGAPLDFLRDTATAERSLSNYLASTSQYRHRLKVWKSSPREGNAPSPDEILSDAMERGFGAAFGNQQARDRLTVRLHLAAEPVETNGEWNAAGRFVSWHFRQPALTQEYRNSARNAVASWCEPDASFQNRCFGNILVHGENLLAYCRWYDLLDDARKREWDTMLSSLKPTELGPLNHFRFVDETTVAIREGREAITSQILESLRNPKEP